MAETAGYVNPLKAKQLQEYGEEGINYLQQSSLLSKYIARKGTASQTSAETIRSRLNRFGLFAFREYREGGPFDVFLSQLKEEGKHDPYDLLSEYAAWLTQEGYKANQIRQLVRAAKQFLRHKIVGVKIDNDDFRENVSLPRQQFPEFEGTEKSQVLELLKACKTQRLKTALMLFAVRGPRAIEGCALQHSDIDYENNTITIRAETEKMHRERRRPMTKELRAQLHLWEKIKYAPHWVSDGHKHTFVTLQAKPDDLMLAYWHPEKKPKPSGIYETIYKEYQGLADMLNVERKNGRRVITFHRLRAFAKTTIENLGYPGFAEWWIGHGRDTYYRNSRQETQKLLEKVEPYLTFLDIEGLDAKGAAMESRLDASEARFLELQKQNEKQAKQNELLTAAFLAKTPQEKAAAAQQLREFYGGSSGIESDDGKTLYPTQQLDVLDAAGAIEITRRPKILRKSSGKDGNKEVQIQSLGSFIDSETGERRYFITGVPEDVKEVVVYNRGDKKKWQKKKSEEEAG